MTTQALNNLRVNAPAATAEQVARALAAATAVISAGQATPLECARGHWLLEGREMTGQELTEEQHRHAKLWEVANEAAQRACDVPWPLVLEEGPDNTD